MITQPSNKTSAVKHNVIDNGVLNGAINHTTEIIHSKTLQPNAQSLCESLTQATFSNESFIQEHDEFTVSEDNGFTVDLLENETQITIKIIGEIYVKQQALLNDVLFTALNKLLPVRVDLSELTYFDLDNIQLIFAAQKEAQRVNIAFVVEPLSQYAKQTIRLSGLLYELYGRHD